MNEQQEKIIASFYKVEGVYHTNVLSIIKTEEDSKLFNSAMFEYLNDGDLLFAIDDVNTDKQGAFIIFKIDNKLISEYAINKDGVYHLGNYGLSFCYPSFKMLKTQQLKDICPIIKSKCDDRNVKITFSKDINQLAFSLVEDEKTSDRVDERAITMLAKFWKNGVLVLILVVAIIVAQIGNDNSLLTLVLSIGFFIVGCYYALGLLLKFKHIYCLLQTYSGLKMTPHEIAWDSIKKTNKIMLPLVMIILGIIGLIVFIIMK